MKAKKAIDIFMSIVVAMMLMAGGFARFHHHTPDNRACFCLSLDDAYNHAEAHSHNHGDNDDCSHSGSADCCGLVLDDFQILHDNDDDNHDSYITLPTAGVPFVAASLLRDNECIATVSRRDMSPLIPQFHICPSGLRAPPAI